jgi:2',3'-cyclic-nucleotide 2'-phosphodiesterase / phosphoenolpyruvate phosphatase
MFKVLFIGDICGQAGRRVLANHLPTIRADYDLVVANGENAAGGFGLNYASSKIMFASGVDCITLGNHTWDNKEIFKLLEDGRIIRPINYPPGTPGRGWYSTLVRGERLTVVNAMGRIFMDPVDCPFVGVQNWLENPPQPPLKGALESGWGSIFIDFPAEATDEKTAFAHHFDGRVAAIVGTHTHIPTADTRVLPKGTGYQSDAGMTGALESVIGFQLEEPIKRFVTRMPARWQVDEGLAQINAVSMTLEHNRCLEIERYQFTESGVSIHVKQHPEPTSSA